MSAEPQIPTPETTKKSRRKMPSADVPTQVDSSFGLSFQDCQARVKSLNIKRAYATEADSQERVDVTLALDITPDDGSGIPAKDGIKALVAESAAIVEGKSDMKLSLRRNYQDAEWNFSDSIRNFTTVAQGSIKGTPTASIVKGKLTIRVLLELSIEPADVINLAWCLKGQVLVTTKPTQQNLI